jgi:hypothetical protein
MRVLIVDWLTRSRSAALMKLSRDDGQKGPCQLGVHANPHINKIDIKWRYFSFVKINCGHTLMSTLACRLAHRRRGATVGDPDDRGIVSGI